MVMLFTAWVIGFNNSRVPDMSVGTITESRDAMSFGSEFPMKNTPSTYSHESILFPMMHEWSFTKSKRQRTAKSFSEEYIIYLMDDTPKTIEESYSSLDMDLWKEAVYSEMDSIMS
jgi:catalase (peroxidase I)